MKLSILICSVQKRLSRFALLARHLEQQSHNKPVEILWLGDNKTMTVGEKRNKLLSISRGGYIAFVDDDDWVTDDYIDMLLEGTKTGCDVICFNALYSNYATGEEQMVYFDKANLNVNEKDKRLRMPNHLCAVKREIALRTKFMSASFGEDTNYALRLRNERVLDTQYKINKVLYYYNFDPDKSETWQYAPGVKTAVKHHPMVIMDVVMVSDSTPTLPSPKGEGVPVTKSLPFRGEQEGLIGLTQNAINSIKAENVNVFVLEKSEQVKYANADTFLQRSPFNYNQCLNNGACMGNAPYICFTNNDVLFPEGFVHSVIKAMQEQELEVASVKDHLGHIHSDNLSGFCFVMRRDAYNKLARFKEDYKFWCADNVTWEQVKEHKLKHGWLDIKVWHGVSSTLNKLDADTRESYTKSCVKQFNRDYNRNLLNFGI